LSVDLERGRGDAFERLVGVPYPSVLDVLALGQAEESRHRHWIPCMAYDAHRNDLIGSVRGTRGER